MRPVAARDHSAVLLPGVPFAPAGFSLVEVLVALLILSVGLLGVVTLLLHGLREGSIALSHTQAVSLVGDMVERIRVSSRLVPADLAEWSTLVERTLPCQSGRCSSGVVAADGVSEEPPAYRVLVSWQQPGAVSPMTFASDLVVLQGAP